MHLARRGARWAAGFLALVIAGCALEGESEFLVPPPAPEVAPSPGPKTEGTGTGPTANGEAKAGAESPKPASKPTSPHTLPEAIHKYLRCLHGCPDAQPKNEKEEKEKTKNRPAEGGNGNGGNGQKREETSKKSPGNEKTEGNGGKEEKKDKGDDKEKGNGEDKEKDKDEDKEKDKVEWYSAHAQATVVTQAHDHFRSPYQGPNSLPPVEPFVTSETTTLFLVTRLWECGNCPGELVFNPEVAGGRGFGANVNGIANYPNQEITRVGVPEPTPYIARLYLRQTFGFGGEQEKLEDDFNQVAGRRDVLRLTVIAGKVAATDFVDNNRYSHDSRTSFLPWAMVYNGAWDYPANVRGYTYGVAFDLNQKCWALRYGVFAVSTVANGAALDPHILKANGHILEWERRYTLSGRPGKLRLWGYFNHAHMGKYSEAIDEMPVNPDVTQTRAYRIKYGFGGNVEQELSRDLGAFIRAGWNDGRSESWMFTEIDSTFVAGLVLKGRCWCRPQDLVGLAVAADGISEPHRDYLADGGLGFVIGDGRLNYGLEKVVETFYNMEIRKGIYFAVDLQWVDNPAYNRDRGPVLVGGGRLHLEY
jgi:high affinity Mn2+ porin